MIKVLATTLGEKGGDTVTMTLNWGYPAGVTLFGGLLVPLVAAQISAKRFHWILYSATIVASTTFGTTLADVADRSLGYAGGCFCCCLACWPPSGCGTDRRARCRSTPSRHFKSRRSTPTTITFSQTLGTALGDWLADTRGFGYERGALVFTAALLAVVALYYWTAVSRVTLFWVAFILTRPLGATVGDFIDTPAADGGLALSRPPASAVIAAIIVALLIVLPQRPGRHPTRQQSRRGSLAVGARLGADLTPGA